MLIARITDVCSHNAVIISGATSRDVENIPCARLGDVVLCPIHGVNMIITLQNVPTTDGLLTAHQGGIAKCGAIILTGSSTDEIFAS